MFKKCNENIFFRMDDGRSHASSGTRRENKLVDKEVEALIEVKISPDIFRYKIMVSGCTISSKR